MTYYYILFLGEKAFSVIVEWKYESLGGERTERLEFKRTFRERGEAKKRPKSCNYVK